MSPEELLALARGAATAGARVLASRGEAGGERTLGHAETKSSAGDWVTDFDRGAERAARQYLQAARPGDVLSGEEYPTQGAPEPGSVLWCIDPLDGTANFVRGIVYYATSVGVAVVGEDGEAQWLAGAVVAPALGAEYFAARGGGAYKGRWGPETPPATVGGSRRLAGPVARDDGARVLATGFSYDPATRELQARALSALLPSFENVRRLGSAALDLCLVAEGVTDAYAEYDTRRWDWAAGAVVAEEAGVPVRRPRSEPGWTVAGDVDVALLPGAGTSA